MPTEPTIAILHALAGLSCSTDDATDRERIADAVLALSPALPEPGAGGVVATSDVLKAAQEVVRAKAGFTGTFAYADSVIDLDQSPDETADIDALVPATADHAIEAIAGAEAFGVFRSYSSDDDETADGCTIAVGIEEHVCKPVAAMLNAAPLLAAWVMAVAPHIQAIADADDFHGEAEAMRALLRAAGFAHVLEGPHADPPAKSVTP